MWNITKKTALVLALTLTPISAFAQSSDTTTNTTTAGTTDNTNNNDNRNDNDNSKWGWLGLLGLLGLAGLRRQPVAVIPERERVMTGTPRA